MGKNVGPRRRLLGVETFFKTNCVTQDTLLILLGLYVTCSGLWQSPHSHPPVQLLRPLLGNRYPEVSQKVSLLNTLAFSPSFPFLVRVTRDQK